MGVLYLPEAVRAAQVAEVSVGRHSAVGFTAQNDGGYRKDCTETEKRVKTTEGLQLAQGEKKQKQKKHSPQQLFRD